MKSWLYIKEESIYYFQLLRNWLVGDREAELENFESTRFHLYVELFFFGFILSNDVIRCKVIPLGGAINLLRNNQAYPVS